MGSEPEMGLPMVYVKIKGDPILGMDLIVTQDSITRSSFTLSSQHSLADKMGTVDLVPFLHSRLATWACDLGKGLTWGCLLTLCALSTSRRPETRVGHSVV